MIQVTREPTKALLTPNPDGIIVIFQIPENYVSGTVSVWLNGLRVITDGANGFTELGGDQIEMNAPPLSGVSVQAQYEAVM